MTTPLHKNQQQPVDFHIERRLKTLAVSTVAILIASFTVVYISRTAQEHQLEQTTKQEAAALPSVDVITAQSAPSSLSLTLPGQTAAWFQSTIYGRVDGYVGNWAADIGDHVQKGQILATLETPDLDAELAAAEAKLKADQAAVMARQADADFAKTTYERWKDSPKGVVSEQEREAKKAGYDSAVAQLNEAQAKVGLDQADIDRYTALTQFKQVTAPYDGTITERHLDIGNLVTAGSTSNTTPLYRMVQDDPIRVFVDVPQSAAQNIKNDVVAHITASNIPDKVFDGKVTRTANAINEQTRTLRVEVDIPNSDHLLSSGMYVNVDFQVPSQGLVQVPAAALVFRSGAPQIAVVKDGKIDFRNVAIARDDGNSVEIGSGITVGDKVALNVGSQITQGETVNTQDALDSGNAHAPK